MHYFQMNPITRLYEHSVNMRILINLTFEELEHDWFIADMVE